MRATGLDHLIFHYLIILVKLAYEHKLCSICHMPNSVPLPVTGSSTSFLKAFHFIGHEDSCVYSKQEAKLLFCMLTVTVLDNRRAGNKILNRTLVSFTRMQSAANLFVIGILLLPIICIETFFFKYDIEFVVLRFFSVCVRYITWGFLF